MKVCGCKWVLALGAFAMCLGTSTAYAGVIEGDAEVCLPVTVEETPAPSEEEILVEIQEMQSVIFDIENLNKYTMGSWGLHVENRDGVDTLVDETGNPKYGYGYTDNGDLYMANTHGVLWKDCVYDNMAFDENGIWINPGMEHTEQNRAWSEALERGELICIDSMDMVESFINYYMGQYRLRENNISMSIDRRGNGEDNFSVRLPYEMRYNREELVNNIAEGVGMPIGNTVKELTLSAVGNVCDYFEYDLAYTKRTMEDCLKDKRGVCWVYAKSVKALLDRIGVQSEIMTGFSSGENHMWLRVRDGEKWIYCDPTLVEALESPSYFNIPYNTFVTGWHPQPMAHFERWY